MNSLAKIVLLAFGAGCLMTFGLGTLAAALNPYVIVSAAILIASVAWAWRILKKDK